MQPVVAGLEALGDRHDVDSESVPADIDQVAVEPLLRELHALLGNNNINAAAVVAKLQPLLKQSGYGEQLEKAVTAIEEYDFDTSTAVLKDMAGDMGVEL